MLTREESRQADEKAIHKFHIPSLVLMENAGRTCAETLLAQLQTDQSLQDHAVLVLCGPGNNGGDGFVIARHLYIKGVKVKAVLFRSAESYTGDARKMLDALSHLRMPVVEFGESWPDEKVQQVFSCVARTRTSWVVDAMLGTGATGSPRGPIARAIESANAMNVHRFAVDIPSGLDCDSGQAEEIAFRADVTCTMIAQKAGFSNSASRQFTGEVSVVGIGAPNEILREVG